MFVHIGGLASMNYLLDDPELVDMYRACRALKLEAELNNNRNSRQVSKASQV